MNPWVLVIGLFELLALLSVGHNLRWTRHKESRLLWSFLLPVCPPLSLPVYWLVGRAPGARYRDKAHRCGSAVQDLRGILREKMAAEGGNGPAPHLDDLFELPPAPGCSLDILVNGEEFFEALYSALAEAQSYVLVQFYLIRGDETGREFTRRVKATAERGVRVYLLYDPIEDRLDDEALQELEQAGVDLVEHHSVRAGLGPAPGNFRNHRKVTVVDGRVGFFGGLNVGDEYVDKKPELAPWRDTHFRLKGPGVLLLQYAFAYDVFWNSSRLLELDWSNHECKSGTTLLAAALSGPGHGPETCESLFEKAVERAQRRLWLATPFFHPNPRLREQLARKARQGVDVRVLLPDCSESDIADLATYGYREQLTGDGVRFFIQEGGSMHQKVLLIDDEEALLGSANLDRRSFYLNSEIHVWVHDPALVKQLDTMLGRDMENFEEALASSYEDDPPGLRLKVRASQGMALLV